MSEHDKPKTDLKYFHTVAGNHLDYLASDVETQLPPADQDGILGVIELGHDKDNLDNASHQAFVDKRARTMVLVDLERARSGRLHELFPDGESAKNNQQTVVVIDIKALQRQNGNNFTNGMVYLSPHTAPYVVGRQVGWCRDIFDMDEYTAGAVSSQHLSIRVNEDGVYLKDRDSTNGTLLSTGDYARQAIERVNDRHEFAPYLRNLLGKEAVEDIVKVETEESRQESVDEKSVARRKNTFLPRTEEKIKIPLKPADILRATEEIGKIIGAQNKDESKLTRMLESISLEPDEVRAMLDPITGDENLRQQLLLQLEREVDLLGDANLLPARVQRNDPNDLKNVEQQKHGYARKKYPPREYAARLALAMLDGSFVYSDATVYKDLPQNHSAQGEHRRVARMLLEHHYKNDVQRSSAEMSENPYVKNFQYDTNALLVSVDQSLYEHVQLLYQLQDKLMQQDVDTEELAYLATRFVTETDSLVGQIGSHSFDASILLGSERVELTVAEQEQVQACRENLIMIQSQIENQRNELVFGQMQSLKYRRDDMDVVALRGFATNGSLKQLVQQEIIIKANIHALISR